MIYVYICIYIYNIYIYIYIYNQLVAKTVRWGRSALMDPKLPSLDGRMLGWTGCILRHWHNRVVLSATVDSTFCIFFLIWKAETGAGVGGGFMHEKQKVELELEVDSCILVWKSRRFECYRRLHFLYFFLNMKSRKWSWSWRWNHTTGWCMMTRDSIAVGPGPPQSVRARRISTVLNLYCFEALLFWISTVLILHVTCPLMPCGLIVNGACSVQLLLHG